MSNAKKYFDIPEPAYEDENDYIGSNDVEKTGSSANKSSPGSGLEDTISKIHKKLKEPVKKVTKDYEASIPEKIVPDSRDSLDEVVNGNDPRAGGMGSGRIPGGGRAGNSSRSRAAPSQPVLTPPQGAGKFAYAVGEILRKVRDGIVQDPDDPVYQFSRKVGSNVLPDSDHWSDNVLREVAGMGLYVLINSLFEKGVYK